MIRNGYRGKNGIVWYRGYTTKGSRWRRRSDYARCYSFENIKHVAEYEKKLLEVQMLIERVTGDREVQVLNWMLDGNSQRWIGQHMALSATSIKRIKDNIVKQMIA